VDGADFLVWQRGYGIGTAHAEGDANFDGVVDGDDLTIWQAQFGATASSVTAQAAKEAQRKARTKIEQALQQRLFDGIPEDGGDYASN